MGPGLSVALFGGGILKSRSLGKLVGACPGSNIPPSLTLGALLGGVLDTNGAFYGCCGENPFELIVD